MTIQEAIKVMSGMPIKNIVGKRICRSEFKDQYFLITITEIDGGGCPHLEIYDSQSYVRFFNDKIGGVFMNLEDILAEDWVIVDDEDSSAWGSEP